MDEEYIGGRQENKNRVFAENPGKTKNTLST